MRFRSNQRLCLRLFVYEEKVDCQLGHPFFTVIIYIAKSNYSVLFSDLNVFIKHLGFYAESRLSFDRA